MISSGLGARISGGGQICQDPVTYLRPLGFLGGTSHQGLSGKCESRVFVLDRRKLIEQKLKTGLLEI